MLRLHCSQLLRIKKWFGFALRQAVIRFMRFQQFTLGCENVIMTVFNLAVYTCLC